MSVENGALEKRKKRSRFLLLAVIILLFILGVSAILGGAVLLALNLGTDKDGYALSNVYEVRSSAYAFALWVAPAQIPGYLSWMGSENIVETKWVIETTASSEELFVGWTKAVDGEPYLSRFMFETPPVWHWYLIPYSPEIEVPLSVVHNTAAPSRSPDLESFWLESGHTSSSYEMSWDPAWDIDEGRNILIIMNLDGSSGVEADVLLGFKVPLFGWLPILLVSVGAVLVLVGLFLFRRKKALISRKK